MNNASAKNPNTKNANDNSANPKNVNVTNTNPTNKLKHSSHSHARERDTKRSMDRSFVPHPPAGPIFFPAPVMNQSSSNSSTTTKSQRTYGYFHWAPSTPTRHMEGNNAAGDETAGAGVDEAIGEAEEQPMAEEEGHDGDNGTLDVEIKRAKLSYYNCKRQLAGKEMQLKEKQMALSDAQLEESKLRAEWLRVQLEQMKQRRQQPPTAATGRTGQKKT